VIPVPRSDWQEYELQSNEDASVSVLPTGVLEGGYLPIVYVNLNANCYRSWDVGTHTPIVDEDKIGCMCGSDVISRIMKAFECYILLSLNQQVHFACSNAQVA